MEAIDLHIHTACSDDGEFTAAQIMERCGNAQIGYMAVTDHNSVRAVGDAIAIGKKMGMKVISGVELDCVFKGHNLHLLGYHFDHTRPEFDKIEKDIIRQEQEAAEKKVELINRALGVDLKLEEVLLAAEEGVVTGELIGELLLIKEGAERMEALKPYLPGGNRSDNPYVNFYWDYFSQSKPAYVAIDFISLEEGISLIHAAGGVAVLAHPGQNLRGEKELFQQILLTGLDGLEVYSSYHTDENIEYYLIAARENGLLVTCGSDFHGKTKPSIPLCGHKAGEYMPVIVNELKKAHVIEY